MNNKVVDLAACRAQMPALSNKTYFNYGGQGAIPQSTIDAVVASYKFVQEKGPFSARMFAWMMDELNATRGSLASELGGAPQCWALNSNVTEGCNIVLWGIDWQPGDDLLVSDSEHYGVVNAVQNIARRLKLNLNHFEAGGKKPAEILASLSAAITPRTKLVVFSHVLWNTGQVLPLAEMVAIIAEKGSQSLVDGAQAAGVVPLDVAASNADYYGVTGHKWMGGPEGMGALYVRNDRLETLETTFVGWRKDMTGSAGQVDGSRFEVATTPLPLLSGLRNSIEFHRRFGTAAERYQRIAANARLLRQGLEALPGVRCLGDVDAPSGLVSFTVEGANHHLVHKELEAANLILRTIPTPDALRASVHYFTTEEEIFALIEGLKTRRV